MCVSSLASKSIAATSRPLKGWNQTTVVFKCQECLIQKDSKFITENEKIFITCQNVVFLIVEPGVSIELYLKH